jgi:hypothetical protein
MREDSWQVTNEYRSLIELKNSDKGPGRLLPCDSAPVLQYGSGPFSDLLVRGIFGPKKDKLTGELKLIR